MRAAGKIVVLATAVSLAACAHRRPTSIERFIDGEIRQERSQNIGKAYAEARAICGGEVELLPDRTGEMASDYRCRKAAAPSVGAVQPTSSQCENLAPENDRPY